MSDGPTGHQKNICSNLAAHGGTDLQRTCNRNRSSDGESVTLVAFSHSNRSGKSFNFYYLACIQIGQWPVLVLGEFARNRSS